MLFDRLALLRPSLPALCVIAGVGFGVCGWVGAARAQSPQPSPEKPSTASTVAPAATAAQPNPPAAPVPAPAPRAAPADPVAPAPPSETIGPGSAATSPAGPQPLSSPAGDPPGQAPGPGQAQPYYYGTYAPSSNYPSAPSYTGPLGRAPGPGSHEHEGFFLRFTLGVGAAGVSYKEEIESPRVSDIKTRGLAAVFDIAIGGRVVGNFMVHGNLSVAGVASNREIDGIKDRSYKSLSTTMWMFGAGGTYYFMPTNLYLTLVVGTGGFVETRDYGGLEIEQEQIQSGAGFATSLAVGKEWWVGGRGEWGIGGSITGSFYSVPIEVGDVKSTALGNVISLAFSSTLN